MSPASVPGKPNVQFIDGILVENSSLVRFGEIGGSLHDAGDLLDLENIVHGLVLHDYIVSCPDPHHTDFLRPFLSHGLIRYMNVTDIYGPMRDFDRGYHGLVKFLTGKPSLSEFLDSLPGILPLGSIIAKAIHATERDVSDHHVMSIMFNSAKSYLDEELVRVPQSKRPDLGQAEFYSECLWLDHRHTHEPILEAEAEMFPSDLLLKAELFRTNLYLAVSQAHGLPYSPNSLRAPVAVYKARRNRQRIKSFADIVFDRLAKEERKLVEKINSVFGVGSFSFMMPPMAQIYLSRLSQNGDPFGTIMTMRKERFASHFRKWVRRVNKAAHSGDIAKLQRAVRQLQECLKEVSTLGASVTECAGELAGDVADLASGEYVAAAKDVVKRGVSYLAKRLMQRHVLYIRDIHRQLRCIPDGTEAE